MDKLVVKVALAAVAFVCAALWFSLHVAIVLGLSLAAVLL